MTRPVGRPISLARQYLRWLAALCGLLVFVTVGSALFCVLLPLAQRSADDLAGLMVLSAQTWAELPPETRPDFEAELQTRHQLVLRPGMAAPVDTDLRHGFYLHFLENALAQRSVGPVFFRVEPLAGGGSQVWTALAAGGQSIGVGFSSSRLNTRPFQALAVVLHCAADLHVRAAPALLGRVIDNLIGNALRYAPGTIEVSADWLEEQPHRSVRIRVMDRGPGIPAAQQAAVWRPFQRLEVSRSPQTGGCGLGLAIVQRLAQAQAWPVALHARAGGGLEVSIVVPAAPPPPGLAAAAPPSG